MKIPYLSTVLLYLMFTCTIFGQPYLEWEAQYTSNSPVGIDRGHVITSDDAGNVYVAGKVQGSGNFDYITIKYDKNGQTKWVKTYNGTGNGDDEVNAIKLDYLGYLYITGSSKNNNGFIEAVSIKYDSLGNSIWEKHFSYGSEDVFGSQLEIDNFNNIIVGALPRHLVKYGPDGVQLWNAPLSSVNNKNFVFQINHIDGSIVAAGGDQYYNLTKVFVINQTNGSVLFSYNPGGSILITGIPTKVDFDPLGNIYTLTTNSSNIVPQTVTVAKFHYPPSNSFDYLPLWKRPIITSSKEAIGVDMETDDYGSIYTIIDYATNANRKILLSKVNSNSNIEWDNFIEAYPLTEIPKSIKLSSKDSLGQIYISSINSQGNINLWKYSLGGDSIWKETYNCSSNGIDLTTDLKLDKCENAYLVGYSACNNTGQDLKVIKYSTLTKPKITPSKQNPICENETLILYADTCSTCTYLWSNGNTADSILINPDTTSEYQVTVTNNNGCETVSLPFKVIVKKLLKPEITITPSANSICVGAGTNVMAQTINAGANPGYAWYVNGTLQAGQNSALLPISPLINSQVQCILTTSEQCYVQQKDTSNTINVTVNPLPLASIIALGNTTFCSGNNVLLAPNQATSYLWSNGSTADTITVTESGKYKVTITDTNGCSNASNEITVTVNALPSANIMSSGSSTFCSGDSVILTASIASQYSWSNGATGNQIVVKNSGQFIVTITDQNGCKSSSQIINVVANPLPVLNIISSGDLNLCQGESETLTSSTAGNLYKWSNGQSTPSITVTENGTYQLSVTDANGCQGVASPVTITVHALPVVSINSSGPVTFCQGNNVILTSSNASSYLWSNGITTQSTTISSNGSYSVIVTDVNGCKNSSSPITITVNPLPVVSIVPSGTIHFCMGDSIKLVANGGNQYLWSNTMSTKEIIVKEPANYQVIVTDANGCSAISLSTLVVVDTLPHILVNVLGSLQFCDGDSVVLEAQNADTYVWSNGANSHRIAIKNSGSYDVTGTNSYGCKSVSPSYTSEKQELVTPKVEISTPDLSVCEGAVVTFNTNTIGGGNEPSFQWFVNSIPKTSNSSTYNSNSLINGSSIYCIMTSSEICVTIPSDKSNVLNIAVNALKTPTIEIIQESAEIFECEDGVYKSQISNGGSNPKFKWYVNDILVASGVSFTYSEFIQGDKVNCLLESNAECLTTNNVISNTLYPTVIKKSQPSITVIDGKIQPTNYSTNKYTYKWFLNGVEISTDEIIECADFGPGEYYLEVSINGCTFPSQSKQIENCTVSTNEHNSKEDIIVYPNPTRGIIQLKKGKEINEEFQISITNLLGIKVLEAKSSQFGILDLSSLEAGVYYLTINKINIIKIIKI
ncbi:MAG: T9SS type A sorting domain-containing protein [Saprospiraceae bacterium]